MESMLAREHALCGMAHRVCKSLQDSLKGSAAEQCLVAIRKVAAHAAAPRRRPRECEHWPGVAESQAGLRSAGQRFIKFVVEAVDVNERIGLAGIVISLQDLM